MIEPNGSTSFEEQLESFGVIASNTVGTSMRPLFKTHRDAVVIKKVEGKLKKYDVAFYKVGSRYILHRVIAKRGSFYIIRGDNTYKKEYVPESKVLGVLVSFNRDGKHHEVSELGYKIYSRVWHYLYLPRCLCMKVRRTLKKLFGKRKK